MIMILSANAVARLVHWLVNEEQAANLVRNLKRFEQRGGLTTTDQQFNQRLPGQLPGTANTPTQWAYPNGWAPLHFIVIKALQRYGYHQDAERIANKWLHTNLSWFNKEHVFLEKYNVVNPDKPPVKGVYPSQTGFGWTNAIFEWLCQEYVDYSGPTG
jgi:alpha,alpha-trehalase